ncbi:MAG TPA: PKD domain-containing protein [Flavobacterium sp.]|jgi:hypothetical protein
MYKGAQIKTHFDGKILLFFIILFVVSSLLFAFQISSKSGCELADFKVDAPKLKSGELITFYDNTDGAYAWEWDFGDGSNIAYRSKAVHAFGKPGTYNVKLMVNGSCRVEKVIKITSEQEVLNTALIPKAYGPSVVYVGETVQFNDSTKHANSWEWRFGDGLQIDAIDQNPQHVYRIPGQKYVSLVVNDDMKHIKQFKVTVLPSKKSEKDHVIERIERRNNSRAEVIEEYVNNIPEEEGPEIANLTEEKFKALLLGVSENKLSYQNMLRYFCTDNLPLVQLRNGKTMSLKALDDAVRNKGIRIKSVTLNPDKNGCVSVIALDYKNKGIL